MKNNKRRSFLIFTLLYFLLGFVNIYFAYLAIVCMTIPFVLLIKNKKNIWCHGICPRADFFSLFRFVNFKLKAPKWLFGTKMKNNIFIYFCINIMFIIMSSYMVYTGRILPIDKIRLFIIFQIPVDIPQLISTANEPNVLTHLAFRLYSLMLSSTILGTTLAVLFKPRTWCVICPVKTLSNRSLNNLKSI